MLFHTVCYLKSWVAVGGLRAGRAIEVSLLKSLPARSAFSSNPYRGDNVKEIAFVVASRRNPFLHSCTFFTKDSSVDGTFFANYSFTAVMMIAYQFYGGCPGRG